MSIIKALPKHIKNNIPKSPGNDKLFHNWINTWPLSRALETLLNQNRNKQANRIIRQLKEKI